MIMRANWPQQPTRPKRRAAERQRRWADTMVDPQHAKLVLVTGTGDDAIVETPWAFPVGPSHFRLDNIPFYAYGLSLDDIVEATLEPGDPRPHFRRVVAKSGNRTLRVIADDGAPRVPQVLLDEIVALGCSYTGATPRYICINIPPSATFDSVVAALDTSQLQWEHADPTYDQLHPE